MSQHHKSLQIVSGVFLCTATVIDFVLRKFQKKQEETTWEERRTKKLKKQKL